MTRYRLLEEWNGLAAKIIPAEASLQQRTDLKRVFFAGANAALTIVVSVAREPRPAPEVMMGIFEDLIAELGDHVEKIKRGEA